jgi:hypothetical protein
MDFRELETSLASLLILLVLVLTALYASSLKDPAELCDGELSCLLKLVKEEQDSRACSFSLEKEKCYYQVAFYLKEPKLCYSSYEPEQCIFELAVFDSNELHCEFSSQPSFCYYSYALALQDEPVCNLSGTFEDSCLKRLIKS